jgi:hypothetical protein
LIYQLAKSPLTRQAAWIRRLWRRMPLRRPIAATSRWAIDVLLPRSNRRTRQYVNKHPVPTMSSVKIAKASRLEGFRRLARVLDIGNAIVGRVAVCYPRRLPPSAGDCCLAARPFVFVGSWLPNEGKQ